MSRLIDGGYIVWTYGSNPDRQLSWMPEEYAHDVIALDGPREDLFRYTLNPEYKARRAERREAYAALAEAAHHVHEFRQGSFVSPLLTYCAIPGLEADDIIALFAWVSQRLDVVGVDKDLLQLKPYVRRLMKIDGEEVTIANYFTRLPKTIQKEGLDSTLVPLYLCLLGDKSDGIPRLIPPYRLDILVHILAAANPYMAALHLYGDKFLQNLMGIILPFPGVFGLSPAAVFDLVAYGEWRPYQLLGRLDAQIADTVEELHGRANRSR